MFACETVCSEAVASFRHAAEPSLKSLGETNTRLHFLRRLGIDPGFSSYGHVTGYVFDHQEVPVIDIGLSKPRLLYHQSTRRHLGGFLPA